MNWDQIECNSKQLKGNIQQQWTKVPEDDLDITSAKYEELAGNASFNMQDGMGDASDDSGQSDNSESDQMDDSGKHTSIPAPKPMPNPIPDEMVISKFTKK